VPCHCGFRAFRATKVKVAALVVKGVSDEGVRIGLPKMTYPEADLARPLLPAHDASIIRSWPVSPFMSSTPASDDPASSLAAAPSSHISCQTPDSIA
jgi:hypothetical protein